MAKNGISTLPSKQQRQVAKLDLAQTQRRAGGNTAAAAYRVLNTYDLNLLPSQYVGNTSVPNSHPAGLQPGRPWTAE